ncbi:hypothetical protein Tco_0137585, partial [Tanacetum coccineum]
VISYIKARKYIEKGYQMFMAYVTKKKLKEKRLKDVSIIHDFHEVFPDDLPRLPPPRQVEFRIDLVPGAAPVTRAPYRLAPSEMKELSAQLQELLEKGFICPTSSLWGSPVLFVKKKDGSFRINYGVICEDKAKRRNSGAKTKTFEENSYLLPYAISNKEDRAYQHQLITRIRVRSISNPAYHSSPIRRISSWSSVKDLKLM